MKVLALKINDKKYSYGKYKLENDKVEQYKDAFNENARNNFQSKRKIQKLKLDCVFVHYLIREVWLSKFYRINFIKKWTITSNDLKIILKPTKYDLIDYNWNERIYIMVRERCELDHALSWLSTLGGAFSALGDYFPNCADTAGKISINQLKLALRLGDPNIAARCRLYLSLSLIQKKKFKLAKHIIRTEYHLAKTGSVVDPRLLNMCKGIWSKLQYEHDIFRKRVGIGLSRKMNDVFI